MEQTLTQQKTNENGTGQALDAQKKRFVPLDILKNLACLAVIGLHTFYHPGDGAAERVIYLLCSFAVPIFFMCSGYLLLSRGRISWHYTLKKIVKLLWLILIWNIIVFILHAIPDLLHIGNPDTYTWKTLPMQIAGSFVQKGEMWILWYLAALILVYLLLPLLTSFLHRREQVDRIGWDYIRRLFFLWLIFATACVSLDLVSGLSGRPVEASVPQTFRLWLWIQYFLLGGLMKPALEWMKQHIHWWVHLALLALATAGVICYCLFVKGMLYNGMRAEYSYGNIGFIIWTALLFLFVVRTRPAKWAAKAAEKIVPLTLGIYIIHPYIKSVGVLFLRDQTLGETAVLYLFTLFATGLIIWVVSKTPLNKWLLKV